MMAKAAAEINWRYYGDAIPAFLTIAIMPFTYSIAYGLIAGILSYITLNVIVWIIEKASFGRLIPPNKHESDPWTYKVPGGVIPPWVKRAAHGKKDFWRPDEESSIETSSKEYVTENGKTPLEVARLRSQGDHVGPEDHEHGFSPEKHN